jgi:hypothetical protein
MNWLAGDAPPDFGLGKFNGSDLIVKETDEVCLWNPSVCR